VIPWIDDEEGEVDEEEEEDAIDFSRYFNDQGLIDTGVTSGSDPSAWDPILIDSENSERDD
jgi:hypothetical protein